MDELVKEYLWSFCPMSKVPRIHLELSSVPPYARSSDVDVSSPSVDPADATYADAQSMVQHHLNIEPVGVGADEGTISPYRFTDVASILQGTAVSYKCNRKKSEHTFQISASLSFITGCEHICLPCSRLNLLTHSSGIRIIQD